MLSAFKTLIVKKDGAILTVTLNRPDVRNAFNDELIRELTAVFSQAEIEGTLRAVFLKGSGKVFCAGGDLEWMKKSIASTPEKNIEEARLFSSMLFAVNNFTKPVVGFVSGAVMGGGIGLVCACDHVVAVEYCIFGFTEARVGLIPAVIGPFVMAKIGESHVRSLFLTAERFSAGRALEAGLVHKIVSSVSELSAESERLAKNFNELSPTALKAAKKFIHSLKSTPFGLQNTLAEKTLAESKATPEALEGIKAFLEKRKPDWSA